MFYKISKNKNIKLKISNTPNQKQESTESLDDSFNTYYYIYSKLPIHDVFISKLDKPQMFYELVEVFSNIYFDFNKTFGSFSNDCFYDFLQYKMPTFKHIEMGDTSEKVDILFFHLTDINEWLIIPMCKKINKNGHFIVKLKYSKKVMEIIYVLTTIFEKTIITRPSIMTINDYIYIICQNYNNTYEYDLEEFILENLNQLDIRENIPCYFINYMNEVKAYITQQILYYKKSMFYLNDEEKMEKIKYKNITYCIKWCETFNIPYNNVNIFNDKFKN